MLILSGANDAPGIDIIHITYDAASEAAAALAVLGYSQGEIGAALKGLDPAELTVEQIIKKALVALMR